MNPKLKEIYDEIPRIVCKGYCDAACGPVPATTAEREEIQRVTGKRVKTDPNFFKKEDARGLKVLKTTEEGTCLYLKKARCVVYEARPIICRLYGVSDGLRCPHGCQPDRWLSKEEAATLIDRVNAVR